MDTLYQATPPPPFETPKILDLEIVTIFNVIVITH